MNIHRRIEELEEATPDDDEPTVICIHQYIEGCSGAVHPEPFQIIVFQPDQALVAQHRKRKRR